MPKKNTIYENDPFMLGKICEYIDGQIKYYTNSCSLLLSESNIFAPRHYTLLENVIQRNFGLAVSWQVVKNYFILFIESLQNVENKENESLIKTLEIFRTEKAKQVGGNSLLKLLIFLLFSLSVVGTQVIVTSGKRIKFYEPTTFEKMLGTSSYVDVFGDYNEKATTASIEIRATCYKIVADATKEVVFTSKDMMAAVASSVVVPENNGGFFGFMGSKSKEIEIAPTEAIVSAHDISSMNKRNLMNACASLYFHPELVGDELQISTGSQESVESFRTILIDLKTIRDKENNDNVKRIDVLSELMFKFYEMLDANERLSIEAEHGPIDAARSSGKDVNKKTEMWLGMILNILENLKDTLKDPYALKNKKQHEELADTKNELKMAAIQAEIIAIDDASRNVIHNASINAEKSDTSRIVEVIKTKGDKAKGVLKEFAGKLTSVGMSVFTGAVTGIAQETTDAFNEWLWMLISSPGGIAVVAIISFVIYVYVGGILTVGRTILTLPWKTVKFAWNVFKWPYKFLGGVKDEPPLINGPPSAPSVPSVPLQLPPAPPLPPSIESEENTSEEELRKRLLKKKFELEITKIRNADPNDPENILRITLLEKKLAALTRATGGTTRRVKRNKKYPTKNKKYGKLRKLTKQKKRGTRRK
jgi:hypothetical protein